MKTREQYAKELDKEEHEVRCNMCYWAGYEENLEITKDGEEFINACPNCKTDEYLMDLETAIHK